MYVIIFENFNIETWHEIFLPDMCTNYELRITRVIMIDGGSTSRILMVFDEIWWWWWFSEWWDEFRFWLFVLILSCLRFNVQSIRGSRVRDDFYDMVCPKFFFSLKRNLWLLLHGNYYRRITYPFQRVILNA